MVEAIQRACTDAGNRRGDFIKEEDVMRYAASIPCTFHATLTSAQFSRGPANDKCIREDGIRGEETALAGRLRLPVVFCDPYCREYGSSSIIGSIFSRLLWF
ncbi:hypothetical protein PHLCEN_2v5874 [Hermanssonia centrifuga]|uniref:Uncharacterized protein n=1 Tax=Hermanssonia centrifuga TaxID=98765 RepID=A0A2R6P154_9APHY|nr:hypothetical protein PHLCEN_2v5874 [Hermanssonia centrifuga]